MIGIRRFIRGFSLALLPIFAALISFLAYGSLTLPDVCRTYGGAPKVPPPFSAAVGKDGGENGNGVCDVRFLRIFPVKTVSVAETERRYVHVGGELVGLRLQTRGVTVVGTQAFETPEGIADPAAEAGIRAGDVLLSVDGETVDTNAALCEVIGRSEGRSVKVVLERDGKELTCLMTPRRTAATGAYKGGVWIRDSTAGIGTLTFSDGTTGRLATLGHPVYDGDADTPMAVRSGEIYTASVVSVKKGKAGAAGEIAGRIGETKLGTVDENGDEGVYGDLTYTQDAAELTPVAHADEAHVGPAQMLCTVTGGEKKTYDVEIERVNAGNPDRNMTVRVTDTGLLAATGGIVQGMSGAPILQDGKLVGAVTHVFVSDPRTGYAIFAERMLQTADGGREQSAHS